MAISVNPSTFVITIPKADLLQVQVTPIEIRELNINNFRLELKNWEDGEGITFQKTHNHNTTVTISGVQLARVVEILTPYTITFEDGAYAVNLVGANSNIADRLNLNQVSVRASNSAGLIQTRELEYASFNGGVSLDINSSYSGVGYPYGTVAYPVNNLADALYIANLRGFDKLFINTSMTIDGGSDIQGFTLIGKSRTSTSIYISNATNCVDVFILNCVLTGILDGGTQIEECSVGDISYVNGQIRNSGLYGTIYLDGDEKAVISNCYTIDQDSCPIIDMGGSGQDLAMPNYSGRITIKNLSSASEEIGIGILSGKIILDSTITAGTIIVSGVGLLEDNTGSGVIVNDEGLLNKALIAETIGIIRNNYAQGSGIGTNQIQLDTGASALNGAYDPSQIVIVTGTGAGQSRLIFQYNGTSKIATVDRDWKILPDTTSEFVIVPNPGREHVNEGLAQGGTINTITLNAHASDDNNSYKWQTVFIRSGAGADQIGIITTYNGTTKVATVKENWIHIPDTTTGYVILPTHAHHPDEVWDVPIAQHTSTGSVGEALDNISAGTSPEDIADAVWNEPILDHSALGSTGLALQRILGMTLENHVEDDIIRDSNGNKISSMIYCYNSAANASIHNKLTGITAKYAVTGNFDANNRVTSFSVILQ